MMSELSNEAIKMTLFIGTGWSIRPVNATPLGG